MNSLTPIAPKLAPLIRRLASDQDGERLACVAALERQLDRAGLTFHDLADRLTTAPDSPAERDDAPVFTDYDEAVEWLLATNNGELTARDIGFLEDMVGILRKWPPSPKQAAWLRSLLERLGGQFHG